MWNQNTHKDIENIITRIIEYLIYVCAVFKNVCKKLWVWPDSISRPVNY